MIIYMLLGLFTTISIPAYAMICSHYPKLQASSAQVLYKSMFDLNDQDFLDRVADPSMSILSSNPKARRILQGYCNTFKQFPSESLLRDQPFSHNDCLGVDPSERYLFIGILGKREFSERFHLALADISTNQVIPLSIRYVDGKVFFSTDGTIAVICTHDRQLNDRGTASINEYNVHVYNVRTKQINRKFHSDQPIEISPQGNRILIMLPDGAVSLIDLSSMNIQRHGIALKNRIVKSVQLLADGTQVIFNNGHDFWIYNLNTHAQSSRSVTGLNPRMVELSPFNRAQALIYDADKTIKCLNILSGDVVTLDIPHSNDATHMLFVNDTHAIVGFQEFFYYIDLENNTIISSVDIGGQLGPHVNICRPIIADDICLLIGKRNSIKGWDFVAGRSGKLFDILSPVGLCSINNVSVQNGSVYVVNLWPQKISLRPLLLNDIFLLMRFERAKQNNQDPRLVLENPVFKTWFDNYTPNYKESLDFYYSHLVAVYDSALRVQQGIDERQRKRRKTR